MRFRIFSSAVLAIAFLLMGNDVRAETHGGTPTPPSGARPDASDALNKRVVDFAAAKFEWDKDELVGRFGSLIPSGLLGALNESKVDENPIALVVAGLFGTVNNTQLKEIFTDAIKEKKQLEEKPATARTPSDNEYLAYLNRVLWAGRITKFGLPGFEMLDDVKTTPEAKFKAFEEAFKKSLDVVLASNREFHDLVEKINKTADPVERAKLQKDLTSRFGGVTKFLDGQVASSEKDKTGEKVAEAVAEALAQKSEAGHNLELIGTGETPLRIELGNDPKKFGENLRQARKEFPPLGDGGFGKTKVASAPLTGGGIQTFKPGVRSDKPPTKGVVAQVPFDDKMMKMMDERGCLSCHTPGEEPEFFTNEGQLLPGKTAKRFLQVLDGCGAKAPMPAKAKKFRDALNTADGAADKETFIKWARANGFETDFSNAERDADYCKKWDGDGPKIKSGGGSGSATKLLDEKVAHLASDSCQLCHSKNLEEGAYFEDDGKFRGGMTPKRFAKTLEGCDIEPDGTMIKEIASVRKALKPEDVATLAEWAKAHNLPLNLASAYPPSKDSCKKWRS